MTTPSSDIITAQKLAAAERLVAQMQAVYENAVRNNRPATMIESHRRSLAAAYQKRADLGGQPVPAIFAPLVARMTTELAGSATAPPETPTPARKLHCNTCGGRFGGISGTRCYHCKPTYLKPKTAGVRQSAKPAPTVTAVEPEVELDLGESNVEPMVESSVTSPTPPVVIQAVAPQTVSLPIGTAAAPTISQPTETKEPRSVNDATESIRFVERVGIATIKISEIAQKLDLSTREIRAVLRLFDEQLPLSQDSNGHDDGHCSRDHRQETLPN